MDLDRSGRVARIFAAAGDLDPVDRPAFVERESGGDASIRDEVSDLLGQDEKADRDDFLGAMTRSGETPILAPEPTGVPGRFEILREHKPGGMGIVYQARDLELGRMVAYKVMRASHHDPDEFRRRFAREAEITARLQYPGIVPVFGMVTDGSGRPAYAMGFIEGSNFGELARRPAPLRERVASFLAACRIVEHAHKNKYVHGDISPKNLMIADDGATHVVDWGLARCLDPADTRDRPGDPHSPDSREPFTPAFAAPSVRKGGPRTPSTDVYSLGAVLAALVLEPRTDGEPDLTGGSQKQVPRALRAIIREATADRLDGLYPDAGALADDVARFLDGDKVNADHEPVFERAGRIIRRHPTRSAVAVASVLLSLVASTALSSVMAAREHSARLASEARRSQELLLEQRVVTAILRSESVVLGFADFNLKFGETFLRPLLLGIQLSPGPISPKARTRAAELADTLEAAERDVVELRKTAMEQARKRDEEALRKLLGELEGMADDFPGRRDLLVAVASCQIGLGFVDASRSLLNQPRAFVAAIQGIAPGGPGLKASLVRIDKGLEMLSQVPADPSTPKHLRLAENLGWELRAIVLCNLQHYTESAIAYDKALAFVDGPRAAMARSMRLACLLMAEPEQAKMPWSRGAEANHDHAIQMAEYLAGQPDVSPPAVYNAGCAFALASLDPKADDAERARRAARALEYLGRIETDGYFRDAGKAKELSDDPDLNPLRSRDDFKALAARVAKGN